MDIWSSCFWYTYWMARTHERVSFDFVWVSIKDQSTTKSTPPNQTHNAFTFFGWRSLRSSPSFHFRTDSKSKEVSGRSTSSGRQNHLPSFMIGLKNLYLIISRAVSGPQRLSISPKVQQFVSIAMVVRANATNNTRNRTSLAHTATCTLLVSIHVCMKVFQYAKKPDLTWADVKAFKNKFFKKITVSYVPERKHLVEWMLKHWAQQGTKTNISKRT